MKQSLMLATLVIMGFVILSFTQNKEVKNLKQKLKNLNGTYADVKPYNYGKAWGQRVFTFNKGKWTLNFTLALDPQMQMPVFEFRTFGTYILQDKNSALPNTFNALFYEEKKFLTLRTTDENLVKTFGFSTCNLTINKEEDISATGCSAWKSVKECSGDYDLLSIDNDGKLYFGSRPVDNDMCSQDKRPTSLTPPTQKIK